MAGNERFEDSIGKWLEEAAPTSLPGRVLDATFERTRRTRQETAWRAIPGRLHMPRFLPALGGAAVVVTAAVLALNFGLITGPAAPSMSPSTPSPTAASSAGSMWPQSTLEAVRAAQERADAGDPEYSWQLDPLLASDELTSWERLRTGEVEILDRFLREVLGWDGYLQNLNVGTDDFALNRVHFLRCAPGRTNPLYPPAGEVAIGHGCAPTINDLTYESVILDLVQPDREGQDGIWVVSNWSPTTFAQVDPVRAEAAATGRLEDFLAARIAGRGAEGYVDVYADWVVPQVPLLYATTSGAPYERFEIDRLAGPGWPYGGSMEFRIRLFADDGATVVEQGIYSHWDGGLSAGIEGGLALGGSTLENGQLVPMPFATFNGEVTYALASQFSWEIQEPGAIDGGGRDFGVIDFTDPAVEWSRCGQGPLPEDAAALAQWVIGNPNFESTAPVAVRVGGSDAVTIDVALAPAGSGCPIYRTDVNRWIHALEPGKRLRLFLVDVPEGMSMQTLAISVIAPFERFDDVVAVATPIIESIEFHPGAGAASPTEVP